MGAGRDWLAGGVVGRPHGLDGSFHVTAARAALLPLGATVRAGDRDAEIVRRAGTDDRPILRLAGVETREAAEARRGAARRGPRSAAPPLEDDEWWAEDLEGCRVVDGDRELGRVARLLALPSCEVLEVTCASPEPFLVPLVRDAVRRVDVPAKVIDIDVAFLGDTVPEGLAAGSGEPPRPVAPRPGAGGPSDAVAGAPSAAATGGPEGR